MGTVHPVILDPQRLAELYDTGLLDSEPDAAFDRYTRVVTQLLEVPTALISLVDADHQSFKSCIGLPEDYAKQRRASLDHSFCKFVVMHDEMLVVNDARTDPRVVEVYKAVEKDLKMKCVSYLGAPLRTSTGHVLGTLCAADGEPHHWTAEQQALLGDLATFVATEIELRRVAKCAAEAKQELQVAHEAARAEAASRAIADANDINARKIAQAALEEANQELERRVAERTAAAEHANRAKSAFLANMSHEIRTPISAIIGFSELMLRPGQTAEELSDSAATVLRNGRHLLDLINDILDLSKIEAGKMDVAPEVVDLPRLMSDLMSTLRPRAVEKGLNFDAHFVGPIPKTIRTDGLRFRQILMNLLGNAIKFTDHGGVSITLEMQGEKLDVAIKDTGVGLTPEQLSRLFSAFAQADESTTRKFGGTGLGLSISRQLARLLGGDITAESLEGVGSVFKLKIDPGPLTDVKMLTNLNESTLPRPAIMVANSNTKISGQILLAEDGRDNQRLLTTHLRNAGAHVALAANGKLAVDAATSLDFDLILMDMQMPEMDGYSATAELRKRGCTLPIIALTANAMSEDRAKCIAAGCTDYLSKPVTQQMLLNTVARHLRGEDPAPADDAAGTIVTDETPAPAAPVAPKAPPAVDVRAPAVSTADAASGEAPIVSSLSSEPGMTAVIDAFIAGLPEDIALLQSLLDSTDLQPLKNFAHELKGAGGGYGFDVITQIAGQIEACIKESDNRTTIASHVNSLVDVMRRAKRADIA